MSDESTGATETATAETTGTETEHTAEETKPAETVEFWRQKARDQEKRAKANATAAARLAEIEEAGKSDLEKANTRTAAAEAERDDARAEAMRLRVAVQHGIGLEDADLFLTGRDEETLTAQAKRLVGRESDRKKNGNVVPKEGAAPNAAPNDERAFVRDLFGSA